MKRLSRVLSGIVLLGMLLLSFAGCAGKDEDKQAATSTKADTSTVAQGESSIDTTPYSLDWYMGFPSFTYTYDSQNTLVCKELKKRTGLENVNFIVTEGKDNSKLNALLASNDLPDVITVAVNSPQQHYQLLVKGQRVWSLNELSEKYAPTFMNYVPQAVQNWHESADGQLYGYPNNYIDPNKLDSDIMATKGGANVYILARKDIMAQLGIKSEDFSTEAGMIAALKKVKDAKLTSDAGEVLPFLTSEGLGRTDMMVAMCDMFGLKYEDAQGNYQLPYNNPKFKDMLKFFNTLHREGLLSDDNFMLKKKQIEEKIQNKQVFCVMGPGAGGMNLAFKNLFNATEKEPSGPIEFVSVGPLTASDGTPANFRDKILNGWMYTCISKTAKHPDRIIQLFDFLASPEGQMMQKYGIDGVTYTLENGRVKYSDDVVKMQKDDMNKAIQTYGIKDIMWMMSDDYYRWKFEALPTNTADKMVKDWNKGGYSTNVYIADVLEIMPESGTDDAKRYAQIGIYLDEQIAKMLVSKTEGEFESIYTETIKHIDELGLAKLNEYYNQRYQANKKKLGITSLDEMYLSNILKNK